MFNKKQKIHSGESSDNYQAGGDITVNQGMSYIEVKDVAMSIFESNFYKLSEKAATIATQRAEEVVDAFLVKIKGMENKFPNVIDKIENPDVQYALINAQKQYARSGDQNALKILTDLLANRLISEEESLKSIVLNEAIEVISKLTTNQISILTTLFLVKHSQMKDAYKLIETLKLVIPHQLIEVEESLFFYEHLLYAGAVTADLTGMSHQNLEYLISKSYPKDLIQQVQGSALNVIEPPVRSQFATTKANERVFESWNKSFMKGYSLTSVGKAIAITNFNSSYNFNLDLDIWIKG